MLVGHMKKIRKEILKCLFETQNHFDVVIKYVYASEDDMKFKSHVIKEKNHAREIFCY